jgi:acetoin utilization deacetylase AcuC-like enzyme
VPLPTGADGQTFRDVVKSQWLPKLEAFQPELIFISAGFDAHVDDDMAGLQLVEKDYTWITTEIKKIADKTAKGRIVSALEGGYALSALGRSVVAHIKALLG